MSLWYVLFHPQQLTRLTCRHAHAVPLPAQPERAFEVTLVRMGTRSSEPPVRYCVAVPREATVRELLMALAALAAVAGGADALSLAEIHSCRIFNVLPPAKPLKELSDSDVLYAYVHTLCSLSHCYSQISRLCVIRYEVIPLEQARAPDAPVPQAGGPPPPPKLKGPPPPMPGKGTITSCSVCMYCTLTHECMQARPRRH